MNFKIKKCKICSSEFEQYNSTVTWCSPQCGLELSKIKLADKKKKEEVAERKILNNKRIELMSPSAYVTKYVQPIFNEIARLIDKGLPCIARGTGGKMDGGHYRSVANNTTIRLNMHNIHRQGVYSNRDKAGDNIYYMDGLIDEYGKDYFDFVHYKLNKTPLLRLTTKEYIEVKEKASKIRTRLRKLDKSYTKEERIELRNTINKEIGIYPEEYCEFNQK